MIQLIAVCIESYLLLYAFFLAWYVSGDILEKGRIDIIDQVHKFGPNKAVNWIAFSLFVVIVLVFKITSIITLYEEA